MAGRLQDDQIRWILSLDAKGVQGELVQVSSVIDDLKSKNKELETEMKAAQKAMNDAEKAMIRLEEAGKTNTKQYQYAKESFQSNSAAVVEFTSKIDQNNKAIEEQKAKFDGLKDTLKVNDMTMNQLRERAADLQKQLNTTSASIDPTAYKKLQGELTQVNERMFVVQNTGKSMLSQFAAMHNPIGSAAQAIQGFGQGLKLLMANPVVAILSAIVAVFMALKDTISQNQEAMDTLNRIMAPFKAILDMILNTVMNLINAALKLGEAFLGWLSKAAEGFPIIGSKMKEINKEAEKAVELEKQKQALVEEHRKNIVDISDKESRIAKLRDEASQKDKFNAKERIAKLQEAGKLEMEIVEIKIKEAQADLRILELATDKVKATAEWKDQHAEALAKINQLDTEHYQKQRGISRQLSSAIAEDNRNAVQAAKDALEKRLKAEENALNQSINQLKQARLQGVLTEKDYNKQVDQLTIDSLNCKINIKGQEKDKILQLQAQILDAEIKQQTENDKELLDGLTKTKENQLALIESARNTQLQQLQDTESDQKIYALRAAEIEAQTAKEREGVIRAFGENVKNAEFANAKIREDAIKASGKEVTDAEAKTLQDQANLRKLFAKTTADFERQYNIKTWEQRKEYELRILQKQYEAGLLSLETKKLAETAIEKKYEDEKLKIRQQYGISNLKEQYDSDLALLNDNHEKGLLSEEQYQQALLQIKLKYAQEYAQKGAELIQSGANLVKGIEEAQTAQLDAEYTKRQSALTEQYNQGVISQEEYNKQKEQLDYEQKKKELDLQKKYADVNFAVQVAQIIASTALAAIQSFSAMSSIPIVGPILGAVAAAAAVAAGAIQIAKAKAERDRVKAMTLESPRGSGSAAQTGTIQLRPGLAEGGPNMEDGGYTSPGQKYGEAGYLPVHHGEYVIASDELKQPHIMNMARVIEKERRKRITKNTVSGFAEGGSNTPGVDSNVIAANTGMMVQLLDMLNRIQSGDIVVQTNYGITEMEAAQKRKMEAESKFTRA